MSEYIDRAKIEYSEQRIESWYGCQRGHDYAVVAFKEDIDKMPVADVAPVRHGRWADHREQDGAWSCTACGEEVTICSCGKDKTWEFPYCPNCGAKMDGEADDECVEALRDWLKQEDK